MLLGSVWTDPTFVVGLVGCVAAIVATVYAVLPHRAKKQADTRARFVDERRRLAEHRAELTDSALSIAVREGVGDWEGMLSKDQWRPTSLVQVNGVSMRLDTNRGYARSKALQKSLLKSLPWSDSGSRFARYSDALGVLARPKLYSDLPCYRPVSIDMDTSGPVLDVALTTFFRGVDESEALAHEAASRWARDGRRRSFGPIRRAIEDATDLSSRSTIMAVSALTLRREPAGTATFFLHSRDSSAVAIAGSLLHLAPSGVFQPTSDDLSTMERDCHPWLTLCREFAEEFLGVEEAQGESGVALSYTSDEPYAAINNAYSSNALRVYIAGFGLDPLTLCGELVTVCIVEADTFDSLFKDLVSRNHEGFLRGRAMNQGQVQGYEFNLATLESLSRSGKLSPAARAALAWARDHSRDLLGVPIQ